MKVKILSTPEEKPKVPQLRPYSSPYEMPVPFKAYGGAIPNKGTMNNGSGMPNRVMDMRWDWLNHNNGVGYQPGPFSSVGKTLPESDNPDIVVEKKEKIMGDFAGDGSVALMGVDTGSHESGNDQGVNVPPNSVVYSDTPSLKADYLENGKKITPAKAAATVKLQDYKKVIDDKEQDELAKKTAQYNYVNGVNRLNSIFSKQESIKQHKGLGEYKNQPQMSKYGGAPMYLDGGNFRFDLNSTDSKQPSHPYYYGQPMDEYTITDKNLQPPGAHDIAPYIQMPVGNNYNPQQMTVPDMPSYVNPYSDDSNDTSGSSTTRHRPRFNPGPLHNYMNPDTLGYLTDAVRAASIPNYTPSRQTARGATPQTVFMDPARALTAIQESANSQSYNTGVSGNGPIGRAISSQAMGNAGAQSADVVGKYHNENVSISNRANQIAADVYNKLNEQQNVYNKSYDEEMANVYRDRFAIQNTIQNDMMKRYQGQYSRQQQAHNYNYLNPYYTMDAQGFIHPKTPEQQRAVLAITNSGAIGSGKGGDNADAVAALWQEAKSKNLPDNLAELYVKHHLSQRVSSQYDAQGRLKSFSERGYADEEGRPPYQKKYGGSAKKTTKMRIISTP